MSSLIYRERSAAFGPMGAKTCILCGAAPPPPLTGEHIWPDWYNRQQPNFRYEMESDIDGTVSVRPMNEMNVKPKVLCEKPCNGEWGSDLEKRIAPILTPMIQGETCQLDGRAAQLISAWFLLKAMVSEYLVPSGVRLRRFFELEHGEHLKATLRPPEGIAIWIGQYVGSRADAGWVTDRSSALQVSDDPPAGILWHSVTYSIGQVLLHLFAGTKPVPLGPLGDFKEDDTIRYSIPWAPGDWDSGITRIWPPPSASISWPPQKAFDDNGFVYLADRWNPQEPPSPKSPPPVADGDS